MKGMIQATLTLQTEVNGGKVWHRFIVSTWCWQWFDLLVQLSLRLRQREEKAEEIEAAVEEGLAAVKKRLGKEGGSGQWRVAAAADRLAAKVAAACVGEMGKIATGPAVGSGGNVAAGDSVGDPRRWNAVGRGRKGLQRGSGCHWLGGSSGTLLCMAVGMMAAGEKGKSSEGDRYVVNHDEGLTTVDFGDHVSLAEKESAGMAGMAGRGGLARGRHNRRDGA
ncbi:hypothetical protein BHE74_00027845 [Ensete ventricosum]|nr:hypothetical protein BHE74_00027845 [Ensete ventricosum]RZS05672.1 hypothetical protein BHM03_00036212 [Ensete ventricosum]